MFALCVLSKRSTAAAPLELYRWQDLESKIQEIYGFASCKMFQERLSPSATGMVGIRLKYIHIEVRLCNSSVSFNPFKTGRLDSIQLAIGFA